jgi:hypothetical protein
MQKTPLDWVTGEILDPITVRRLEDGPRPEDKRKLDRHHVFPQRYLKDQVGKDQINHGVNGVLLSKKGNQALGNRAPRAYLRKILDEQHGLTDEELRNRVESHLVPYGTLMSQETPAVGYRNFIKQRAVLLAEEIARLVQP